MYYTKTPRWPRDRQGRALEKEEEQLGPEHPATLRSVTNLALVLYDRGKLAEAETLCALAEQAGIQGSLFCTELVYRHSIGTSDCRIDSP